MRTVWLALCGLIVSLLVGVAAPAQAESCATKRSGVAHYQTVHGENVMTYISSTALQCQAGGRHWVKGPQRYTVGYDTESHSRACGISDAFDGIVFNGYYWDGKGHNVNPGAVVLSCQHDGTNHHTFYLSNEQQSRFVRCSNSVPRQRFSVHIRVGLGYTDAYDTLSTRLWWFTGPVLDEGC